MAIQETDFSLFGSVDRSDRLYSGDTVHEIRIFNSRQGIPGANVEVDIFKKDVYLIPVAGRVVGRQPDQWTPFEHERVFQTLEKSLPEVVKVAKRWKEGMPQMINPDEHPTLLKAYVDRLARYVDYNFLFFDDLSRQLVLEPCRQVAMLSSLRKESSVYQGEDWWEYTARDIYINRLQNEEQVRNRILKENPLDGA